MLKNNTIGNKYIIAAAKRNTAYSFFVVHVGSQIAIKHIKVKKQ